ncbi:MAG TPA: bifunctional [glutamate--ammonia ligase]-adenylyl-L-tyrosine phosphorylase/[glutamate--ammonia-ligase] adenylyltransferase [Candidatus Binatia bacterium]
MSTAQEAGSGTRASLAERAGLAPELVEGEAAYAAQPELALARAADLSDVAEVLGGLSHEERIALFVLLGGSGHLSRVLRSLDDWPGWLRAAVRDELPPPELDVDALVELAHEQGAAARELRRWRQRAYLRIGARDLWGLAPITETFVGLTETAETAITAATAVARAQLEAQHGTLELEGGRRNRFAVLGFGKLGACELNYSSDVDLVFVHESDAATSSGGARGALAAQNFFTRLAERTSKLLSEVTADGFVFRVDLRLRPDGMNGPLTNSLAGTLQYYEALGQTWERAALFKARPVGGDRELGDLLLAELEPFIYRRTLDYTMIADLEAMKARVEAQERGKGRGERNVKLGPGGIREIEFLVQSFAMVHGGKDRRLRERSTLGLLQRLLEIGLLQPSDGEALAAAYPWLRRVEHALQIDEDRQVHVLPEDAEGRTIVARRLGLHLEGEGPVWRRRLGGDALARFEETHARHTSVVRAAFSELFRERREQTLRSADEATRTLIDELDAPDARERAARLGFEDPDAALAALRLIRDGAPHARASAVSRRTLVALAPALLDAVRQTARPDRALARLADFLVRVGARRTFLALLAENPATLRLLVTLFASSDYLSNTLLQHPELLDTLVRADLAVVHKSRDDFARELDALLEQAPDFEGQLDVLRRYRNDEFLRIGSRDVFGELHYSEVSTQLSDLAEVCLSRAYDIALAERSRRYVPPAGLSLAVVALGKLGGRELNYHSDLDLIFIYGPSPESEAPPPTAETSEQHADERTVLGPQEFFAKVAQLLLLVLQLATREGYVYKIDTRLRPSGRFGPLVTSLEGFAHYHAQSSALWERQALIRARTVCGPEPLAKKIHEIIEGFVFGRGLTREELAEIARMRSRMERELAREDEKHVNLKVGRGGLVDIEFIAQALALEHGHARPELRQRATRPLLDALGAAGLLSPDDLRTLVAAHSFLRGLENRLRIEGEHPIERITRDPVALVSVARRMGITEEGAQAGEVLLEELDRHRDAVRDVFQRLVGRAASG